MWSRLQRGAGVKDLFLKHRPNFQTQVKVMAGAVRDPARFLEWADVVLLVSKNRGGGATAKENVSHNL